MLSWRGSSLIADAEANSVISAPAQKARDAPRTMTPITDLSASAFWIPLTNPARVPLESEFTWFEGYITSDLFPCHMLSFVPFIEIEIEKLKSFSLSIKFRQSNLSLI